MFHTVLIANRGAIARRIIRTLQDMGIRSIAIYSDADRDSPHVREADESRCVGSAPAADSYLNSKAILAAAKEIGAQAIHPGYGFLSESAEFALACEAAQIVFLGPQPDVLSDFGLKHRARTLAERAKVPLLPGTGLLRSIDEAAIQAQILEYPVMLKSTAGGGGIGMQLCKDQGALTEAFETVERLARNHFANGGIFLEKYVANARHIEVQIIGDGNGQVIALGERDCSLQRRNQKVIEESPAPGISTQLRQSLYESAVRLGKSVNYRSAGTVEYIVDANTQEFYFLEVNTRLQVEHGVTEAVTGVDLVEWMLRIGAGETDFLNSFVLQLRGHAVQARLYAEDPGKNYQPSAGLVTEAIFPDSVRVDTWLEAGLDVSAHYDPMLAKLIAWGDDRDSALNQLNAALEETSVYGVETNRELLLAVLSAPEFVAGRHHTRLLDNFHYQANTIDVLAPGTQSTIQDFPGRVGYWSVGVPPSGPMDSQSLQMANRAVGNPPGTTALECTLTGPTLRFNAPVVFALTGALMSANLDGEPVPWWQPVIAAAGSTLQLGAIDGPGCRTYLAVRGGFDVPDYLGSRATFTLGKFGGHCGRALRAEDVLRLGKCSASLARAITPEDIPSFGNHWTIGVRYGPHGAPDFFTEDDMTMFFETDWEVHYNSSRTGVRLIGPTPEWARADGGEAGLHPSNIHDNAYAIGAVDFTGDMPVILGPDGPSLGGFVCPVTVVTAELWKLGQLAPGDRIRFNPVAPTSAVLYRKPASNERPEVCCRQAGDRYILVEYGPQILDLNLRFRIHALMQYLQSSPIAGVLEMTPGIRSLQIHYDNQLLTQASLLRALQNAETNLPPIDDIKVASRIVHLPLSWDDSATRLAIEKYTQSVRPDAPWCPSNIEFIKRINGLDSIDDVRSIVFDARYLVLGLGDVYLGAPVATPMDPRHRLVTTKYNPARTWTPENAVGIGGAYLCIYGMEGPGGYQFVGRTVQMWNRYRTTESFEPGKPWLLRFFDQIRFYPVSEVQLQAHRDDFLQGRFTPRIEQTTLDLSEYNGFIRTHADTIGAFKARQQQAFDAERERWQAAGQTEDQAELSDITEVEKPALQVPADCIALSSPVTGNIWQVDVRVGQSVAAQDTVVVVEAMKMEVPVLARYAGEVVDILCEAGSSVVAGQPLLLIRKTHD